MPVYFISISTFFFLPSFFVFRQSTTVRDDEFYFQKETSCSSAFEYDVRQIETAPANRKWNILWSIFGWRRCRIPFCPFQFRIPRSTNAKCWCIPTVASKNRNEMKFSARQNGKSITIFFLLRENVFSSFLYDVRTLVLSNIGQGDFHWWITYIYIYQLLTEVNTSIRFCKRDYGIA